jgi:hypothetical protein
MQLHGGFTVPKNYIGSASLKIVWTAEVTTGVVYWFFWYRTIAGDDTTSLDQAGTEGTPAALDNAPGVAHRRLELSIPCASADFAADDEVEFTIGRAGADANDTLAGSAILMNAFFEYSDV